MRERDYLGRKDIFEVGKQNCQGSDLCRQKNIVLKVSWLALRFTLTNIELMFEE